jgi:hypothetical protein
MEIETKKGFRDARRFLLKFEISAGLFQNKRVVILKELHHPESRATYGKQQYRLRTNLPDRLEWQRIGFQCSDFFFFFWRKKEGKNSERKRNDKEKKN